jgi:DNA-binding CsgD family transcriptional regulator/PAS domain-containing protein
LTAYDTFDGILMSLHDAMLDDAHWPQTSALIDDACGMKGNALVVGKGQSQKDGQIFLARFCYHGERHPERERWYFALYYSQDERVPRVAQLPDSSLVRIDDLYTEEELRRSPAYNEALPRGGYQHGLNVRLDGLEGSSIVWTLADSSASGGWGSGQIELIERLLPHVRQYVQVRWALASAEALGASLTDLLDNTRVGVVHLDQRGRMVEANDRAREILRRGDGLFDEGGFLHARLPADNIRLQKLVEGVLPTFGGPGVSGSMAVGRLPQSIVHLNPVSVRQTDFGLGSVAALALVVDPASRPRVDPGLVASVLGLTPAQSQVAALLAEGMSVNEVAAATHRQANAAYWLLKQIYKKLGISRQADLVRLVLSAAELPGSGR